jgi:hypothetical protein
MIELGHDSPESAAMVGFPKGHCRVVASRTFEDDAHVLLDTGSPGQPYLYGSICYRRDGWWFEAGSSNGPGWGQTSHDPDLGTLSFWGDAPERIDTVSRVRGHYLGGASSRWRLPSNEVPTPPKV